MVFQCLSKEKKPQLTLTAAWYNFDQSCNTRPNGKLRWWHSETKDFPSWKKVIPSLVCVHACTNAFNKIHILPPSTTRGGKMPSLINTRNILEDVRSKDARVFALTSWKSTTKSSQRAWGDGVQTRSLRCGPRRPELPKPSSRARREPRGPCYPGTGTAPGPQKTPRFLPARRERLPRAPDSRTDPATFWN